MNNQYLQLLLLERGNWEGELRRNYRGGLEFIKNTGNIREYYIQQIERIDTIIADISKES